jgi:hypothetical protein
LVLERSWVKWLSWKLSSPVRTYLRCILGSISVFLWVCRRVGMVPWYLVDRLTRSMCMPYVQPCAWVGGLLMVTLGVVVRVIGGAIGSSEYH